MPKIYVCTNVRRATDQPSCGARGSEALLEALKAGVHRRGLSYEVESSVCFGHCSKGPNVKVSRQALRHSVQLDDVDEFLEGLTRESG